MVPHAVAAALAEAAQPGAVALPRGVERGPRSAAVPPEPPALVRREAVRGTGARRRAIGRQVPGSGPAELWVRRGGRLDRGRLGWAARHAAPEFIPVGHQVLGGGGAPGGLAPCGSNMPLGRPPGTCKGGAPGGRAVSGGGGAPEPRGSGTLGDLTPGTTSGSGPLGACSAPRPGPPGTAASPGRGAPPGPTNAGSNPCWARTTGPGAMRCAALPSGRFN